MCAFDYPQIDLASVEVDVPMYTKTDNKLDNMQQGHVTADEPEEPGFYRTRTGAFLRKNKNGAWSALFINGDLIPRYWNDQDDYAKWRTVLDCLYPRAFPLTPTTAPYPLKG